MKPGASNREAYFRALLEAAPDAVVITDAGGKIVLVNSQAEQIFGHRREALIGRPVDILIPERFRQEHAGYRAGFVAAPRVRAMGEGRELCGRRADGTEFPVSISLSPVETEDGALVIAAVRDVTEAKRAEKELRDRETKFRALLEAAPDAVVIVNRQGRIELVNAQTEQIFGYPRDRLLGQPLDLLIPERFRGRHAGHLAGYVAEPRTRRMGFGMQLFGLRADGSEFPVAISLSPVETAEGSLTIAAIRDVTERRKIDRKVEELNTRLTQDNAELATVNQELESFSYSVSHDLRAPLRAIDGFSQALLEDCAEQLDETARDYLGRVRRAAQRMGVLIDDLIKLSRVARADMNRQQVDLSALAQGIAQELQGEQPDRMAAFVIAPDLTVEGDAHLLRIALENLLGNAWKFTAGREPTRIEFGRTTQGEEAAYFVRDNGAGFDMEHADQLFRAFQRLHDAAAFPGTGIGLATVQRIIHKHGGRVWAEGEPGRGATFYFTL